MDNLKDRGERKKRSDAKEVAPLEDLFPFFHVEIFQHAHPQTQQSIFLCLRRTHTHVYFTVHVMIYSQGGGSAFVQMCVSLNACPQKDKNHWPVLHGAHRHWHALHQAKESLFSTRLLISASKHSLSSSIFSNLICQRLKKQRQKSGGEKSLPMCCYSCSAEKQNSIWRCLKYFSGG